MLTSIKGIYHNGIITLTEQPHTDKPIEVEILFKEEIEGAVVEPKKRAFGFAKGFFSYIAPDFNEPLDELKDYM